MSESLRANTFDGESPVLVRNGHDEFLLLEKTPEHWVLPAICSTCIQLTQSKKHEAKRLVLEKTGLRTRAIGKVVLQLVDVPPETVDFWALQIKPKNPGTPRIREDILAYGWFTAEGALAYTELSPDTKTLFEHMAAGEIAF